MHRNERSPSPECATHKVQRVVSGQRPLAAMMKIPTPVRIEIDLAEAARQSAEAARDSEEARLGDTFARNDQRILTIQTYEGRLLRQLEQILRRLESLQARRLGTPVPRVEIDLHGDAK